jgi:hypothetical protein
MRPLQSLTLEAVVDLLSDTFGRLRDPRQADRVTYSLHDTLMSGFALMFFQHASLFRVSTQDEASSWSLQPGDALWGVRGALGHPEA